MPDTPPAPQRLRANHLDDGLGIDPAPPLLSWLLPWSPGDAAPVACDLAVADSAERLETGPWRWRSGRIADAAPMLRCGTAPAARERLWWRVRVEDALGRWSAWSAPAWFEAVIGEEDWSGAWVAIEGFATPLFRCAFAIDDLAAVVAARWYLAAGGLAEPRVNGAAVLGRELAPEHTDYARRVTVAAIDVRAQLRAGENVAALALGGGWFERNGHGRRRFRSQLELRLADGSLRVHAAGPGDWMVRHGPWLAEDIVHGEWYDARLEAPGWDAPGFAPDAGWHRLGRSFGKPPNAAEPPGGRGVAAQAPPLRVAERREPALRRVDERTLVADVGVNIAGRVALAGSAPAGTTLHLRYAEELGADGRVEQRTNKGARGLDAYVFRGEGRESWAPRFAYHGFRYVQVECDRPLPEDLSLRAEALQSDCPQRCRLEVEHEGLAALLRLSLRSIRSNLLGLLTDCPQRDERQGWLADAWAVTPTVLAWFDVDALYAKWLDDMALVQDEGGLRWSATAPPCPRYLGRKPRDRSRHRIAEALAEAPQADSVYTAALTLIPWQLHLATGEPGLVERWYPRVAAHLAAMLARDDAPLPDTSWHGDHAETNWLRPGRARVPARLIAAMVLARELVTARDMALALGLERDAGRWRRALARLARAATAQWYDAGAGSFGSQAADALALDAGIVAPRERPRVLQAILADLERCGGHCTTGVVATGALLRVLAQAGHQDAACAAVTVPDEPGWLWMVARGHTALTEHLVSNWPDTSQNQPALALVCEWMLAQLAGLQADPAGPGYARLRFAPRPAAAVPAIRAQLETPRGPVVAGWRRDGARLEAELILPPGCDAELSPPPGARGVAVDGGPWRRGMPLRGAHHIAWTVR